MDRRAFLISLVAVGGCGSDERSSRVSNRNPAAQGTVESRGPELSNAERPGRIPRVAILVFGSRSGATATAPGSAATLVRGRLAELGYVVGSTIVIDERYADGDAERLTELAREVVAAKPDVIVAIAAAATAAARQATSSIPIVMAHAGDPVGSGMAASLSRPGGNVTGTTSMVPDLGVKQVELLRELIPGLARLGVLANPSNPGAPALLANVKDAARRFGIELAVAEVTRAGDFDVALQRLSDVRPDALLVMIEPMIFLNRARVLDFAASNRLPTSFDVGRQVVREGGLISYGPVLMTHYALVADYVDRILRGAVPGELPIQQPTEFALVINLKTAKALGVTVPQSLLARADEVIQ